MTTNSGAQFEISLDGVPRTYRDRHDLAVEAAGNLKRDNHRCEVAVRDMRTNEQTIIGHQLPLGINVGADLPGRKSGRH